MNRMLKVDKRLLSDEMSTKSGGPLGAGPRNFYMRIIRHQLPIMVVFFILSMTLGVIYLLVTVPTYVATATMMIDTRKAQLLDPQASHGNSEPNVDIGMVQTQIELLKSQNVSRAVIKELHLTDDPEFIGGRPGFISALMGRIFSLFSPPPEPPTESQLTRRVLAVFEGKRTVTRVGQSYVMEIGVQSTNPEKAAKIANAIANAYIDDQLEAKYEATRRASVWLQDA
jgi:succinoglycan biosynthesis transport protein ExoP